MTEKRSIARASRPSAAARFPPRRILAATDLGPSSAAALRAVKIWAALFGAEVTVLHAQHFDAPAYFTSEQTRTLAREMKAARARAAAALAGDAAKILGAPPRALVVEKPPVDAVLSAAQDWDADLIALGTHGRRGAARLWLGSVAEGVLRRSDRPVLAVGPAAETKPMRRILCPVGEGATGAAALAYAAALARALDAKLLLLHAAGKKPDAADCPWDRTELGRLCEIEEIGVAADPAGAVLRAARDRRADLVVMGARRSQSAFGPLFSSTTERVMRLLGAPLLVIPGPEA